MARLFLERGVARGDFVTIALPNCIGFFEASFERVPATNLACLHALNTSINAVIIELCKTLHGRVAALSAGGAPTELRY